MHLNEAVQGMIGVQDEEAAILVHTSIIPLPRPGGKGKKRSKKRDKKGVFCLTRDM
jgi:hypothetical protein